MIKTGKQVHLREVSLDLVNYFVCDKILSFAGATSCKTENILMIIGSQHFKIQLKKFPSSAREFYKRHI